MPFYSLPPSFRPMRPAACAKHSTPSPAEHPVIEPQPVAPVPPAPPAPEPSQPLPCPEPSAPVTIRYLIDSENTGRDWIPLVEQREPGAEYLLFYTENSPTIPLSALAALLDHRDVLRMMPCHTGSNALDFQLVTYLGYLLSAEPTLHYVIFSQDTGFDSVVKFWRERGFHVRRATPKTIASAARPALPQPVPAAGSDPSAYEELLRPLVDPDDVAPVARILEEQLRENKSNHKTHIHTALAAQFGQPKGGDLYRACKSLIQRLISAP